MAFITHKLRVDEYEATVFEILHAYGTPLSFYEIVDTIKYGKWGISLEDIGLLISYENYVKIREHPHAYQKHFFYDSDYYIFYAKSPQSNEWEFGIGKDYDRKPYFVIMEE